MSAPFIPKTSVKLRRGDFAMLKREDGRYVPLVFLSPVPGKRVVFYGALLTVLCDAAYIPEGKGKLCIAEVAMIDIDVFSELNAPILGNLGAHLSEPEVEERLNEMRTRSLVWGRRTPLKYANNIATAA
jgi:hypothetical protein